jgi:Flp pilus assembly pilin Flp
VIRVIQGLLKRENGQDLSEYCLITALIALIALGIFWHAAGGISALWSNSNTSIASAGNAAGAGPGDGSVGTSSGSSGGEHADQH